MTVHYIHQTCPDSNAFYAITQDHRRRCRALLHTAGPQRGFVEKRMGVGEWGRLVLRSTRSQRYDTRTSCFVGVRGLSCLSLIAHHNKAIWSHSGLVWRAAKCAESCQTTAADTKHHYSFTARKASVICQSHPWRDVFKSANSHSWRRKNSDFRRLESLKMAEFHWYSAGFVKTRKVTQVAENLQTEPISSGGNQWEATSLECSCSN